MHFTPREAKLIARLRKREQQWGWTRWILLGMGTLILASCGYIGPKLFSIISSDDTIKELRLYVLLSVWPVLIVMSCMAGYFIGLAIVDWHGNVTRMMLLRLLEAQEERTESKSVS